MTSLVDRLRDNSTLVICPFDCRSPEYWSTPNDKPCKFCGSEPDGPDKCTGADTRVMVEAADRIEELERQLERRTVTATLLALEVAAKVAETLPSNTGMYLDRRDIAKAIRAISDSAPTLLQEQKDNAGKEEG